MAGDRDLSGLRDLTGLAGLANLSEPALIQAVANAPIGVQEMVMAAWLIAKGFNPSATAAEPARQLSSGE